MDDTQRPAVPIHMDMPGWSKTFGYFTNLYAELPDHHFTVNLNGFSNLSTAEMTMYPANSNEKLMFMYTWPQVRTLFQGIYLDDHSPRDVWTGLLAGMAVMGLSLFFILK